MKFIFKYVFVVVGVYLGVNWAADNPKQVEVMRKEMNSTIDKAYSQAQKHIKENTQ